MKFSPVLKWMINITLVLAIVLGAGAAYIWTNVDRFVTQEIHRVFATAAPDLKLKIGNVELDGTDQARLSRVQVFDAETRRELFRAKEIHVDIDSAQLADHWRVVPVGIHLKSADVLLTRLEDGRWNWQQYEFHPPAKKSPTPPQIDLTDLRVLLTLKHSAQVAEFSEVSLPLSCPSFQAVPASQHSYDFEGAITLSGTGTLDVGGFCDMDSGEWKVGGAVKDVLARQDLMNLAVSTNPELKHRLEELDRIIRDTVPSKDHEVTTSDTALMIGSDRQVAPRFQGILDLDFNAGSGESAVPDFQMRVRVRNGQLSSPVLPLNLTGVNATFYRDNTTFQLRVDEAEGDGAKMTGHLLASTVPGAAAPGGHFKVERFPISKRLRPLLLNEKTQRIFDAFQPVGLISAEGDFVRTPAGKWRPQNVRAELHEATVVYHKFRYPVSKLAGTLVQREFGARPATETETAVHPDDVVLDVKLTGMLGDRPVVTEGWWKNPGTQAETRFVVGIQDFPLDNGFRAALEDKHRHLVESLDLTGTADATLVFYRPPGLDQPTHPFFDVHVKDAEMRFEKFPYDIDQLSGRLTYHGPTRHWQFHDLKGQHGSGQLTAKGNFRGAPHPGVLDLTIAARGAALDTDLFHALSPSHRNLWNVVNPSGYCDLTTQIHWTVGQHQPAIIRFPDATPVRIYNTKIRPKPFPFDMYVTEATLSYDPNDPRNAGVQHCEIHSYKAMHGDAALAAKGWIEGKPNGEWQVHLNDVNAVNLKPDDQLRSALPDTWDDTLNRVARVGTLSIHNSELDFRGDIDGRRNTTARWQLNVGFRDCAFNAGLDMMNVQGAVTASGLWDGFQLQNQGEVSLESAEVLEMPLKRIRGPYTLNDVELVLGARGVFSNSPLSTVNSDNRMSCNAYGGKLLFDARVDMRDLGQYQFFAELADARLESYAALHIPDQQNLKGVITAWMKLDGYGDDAENLTGKGQLLINPAALYELPVMVKLLGSLSKLDFNVQNRTAFDYALVNYDVADEAFLLKQIDLVGEAFSLRGQGAVAFDGAVDLDFFSRPARTRTVALPFISGLFTNWAKIEITGTTERPHTRTAPLGQLDDGMKQFLQPFNPSGPIPGLVVPSLSHPGRPILLQRRQEEVER